jgi:hypothetical protein
VRTGQRAGIARVLDRDRHRREAGAPGPAARRPSMIGSS